MGREALGGGRGGGGGGASVVVEEDFFFFFFFFCLDEFFEGGRASLVATTASRRRQKKGNERARSTTSPSPVAPPLFSSFRSSIALEPLSTAKNAPCEHEGASRRRERRGKNKLGAQSILTAAG